MRSMRIGRLITRPEALDIGTLRAQAAEAAASGLDSVWTNQAPGGWDPLGLLAAFGQDGPAELGTAGPEEAVLRELRRFRDVGVTDLVVLIASPPSEGQRTLDLITQAARDA